MGCVQRGAMRSAAVLMSGLLVGGWLGAGALELEFLFLFCFLVCFLPVCFNPDRLSATFRFVALGFVVVVRSLRSCLSLTEPACSRFLLYILLGKSGMGDFSPGPGEKEEGGRKRK